MKTVLLRIWLHQNTVCGHREANKCNKNYDNHNNVHFACSEVSCPVKLKFKQGCVSKLLSAEKEKYWEPGIYF